jgi:hypothetical protein
MSIRETTCIILKFPLLQRVFEKMILSICSIRQYTPLHLSAFLGHVEVCQALISANADAAARHRCDAIVCAMRAHDAVRHPRLPAVAASLPSNGLSTATDLTLSLSFAALALLNKRFFWIYPCDAKHLG